MRPSTARIQRGTQEWLARLVATGEWWRPAYWREQSYQENSPWTLGELEEGFAAAMRIFDAKATRKMARERAELVDTMLRDIGTAPLSGLLHLGLEAHVAEVQQYPDLMKRLRNDREHTGAAFELDVMAALCRAGVAFDYEPFKDLQNHPNPDFRLRIGGATVILDAKAAQTAAIVDENQRWMDALLDHLQRGHVPPYEIEYLADLVALHRDEHGRSWIRANIQDIGRQMIVRLRQLSLLQKLPAEDELIVEERRLLRIVARAPLGEAAGGLIRGAAFDVETEAKRITRGLLQVGASQIPSGMKGMVIVRAGLATTTSALIDETETWLEGEGRAYPDLAGALVVCGDVVDEWYWQRVTPVWRAGQQPLEAATWAALEQALNHVPLRVVSWRQSRPRSKY